MSPVLALQAQANPYLQNGAFFNNFSLQGNAALSNATGMNTVGPNLKYQNGNNFDLNVDNMRNNRLTYEELQLRRQVQDQKAGEAKKAGAAIAGLNFKEGIQSVATAEEIGDYFQYMLDQKINLPRQKSAMLPILDQDIDGTKVSIFNESIHAKYPLLGLKLKNTSGQPLTQGPITVYENSTYAGDTRILDLQPNEERYLSYALDQGTEVKTESKAVPSSQMNFKIGETQLTARFKVRQTRTYTIKNRSTKDRTLIIEHPIRSDWKLIEPAKPLEKTRDLYRFTTPVAAGKTITYEVVEEQARVDMFALHGGNPPFYAIGLGIEVKQELKKYEEKLVGLKIQKGIAAPTLQIREAKAYYVQNLSDQDRDFTVDHVIRPDWAQLGDKGKKSLAPAFTASLSRSPRARPAATKSKKKKFTPTRAKP